MWFLLLLVLPINGEPLEKYFTPDLNVTCSVPVCDGLLSDIYCHGEILSLSWVFGLQATCPGNHLKKEHDDVLKSFNALPRPIVKQTFDKFCLENFEVTASLKPSKLTDWKSDPSFINLLQKNSLRILATELHNRWKNLGREFNEDVYRNPSRYPVIPVKRPFIIPGGIFDVYFYWDSYWIIKGLLTSRMDVSARNIIDNFADLVDQLGYIPNAGNLKLSKRTQPPLFTHMIYDYFQVTKNKSDIKRWLPKIEKELEFWKKNRTMVVKNLSMFVYRVITDCPRPENLLADVELGRYTKNPQKLWTSISSACESGLDFSSRWFRNVSSKIAPLSTTHTDDFIPVDLNVFMALNYRYLSELYIEVDDLEAAGHWRKEFKKISKSISDILWNEKDGTWYDYDTSTGMHNRNFYPSNVFPLLLNASDAQIDGIQKYLQKIGVLDFPGGVPASLHKEGQQWDFPNVWPPSQHLFIKSLANSKNAFLQETAKAQATRFLKQVYNGLFKPIVGTKGEIWEKYNVEHDWGTPGSGGEYKVQDGFGWTNGAALDLIKTYTDVDLEDQTVFNATNMTIASITLTVLLCIIIFTRRGIWRTSSNDDAERQPLTLESDN